MLHNLQDRSASYGLLEQPTLVARVGRLVETPQAGYQRWTDRLRPCGAGNGQALKQRETWGIQSAFLVMSNAHGKACNHWQAIDAVSRLQLHCERKSSRLRFGAPFARRALRQGYSRGGLLVAIL